MRGQKKESIFGILNGYQFWVILLVVSTLIANAATLYIPKIISKTIDTFQSSSFDQKGTIQLFILISVLVFIATIAQTIIQTYTSEIVARDLREKVSQKISQLSFSQVESETPAKLLTNLTSDVDAVKMFVAQAVSNLISSAILIVGASALLLTTNFSLGLVVLSIIPLIIVTFSLLMRQVRTLFKDAQEVIDTLNKVINESIIGSALIRVLNSQKDETDKFLKVNTRAKEIGLRILAVFAALIPIITLVANLAMLAIVWFGGQGVIGGSFSPGQFTAFTSYLTLLIFPVIMIGFMSNIIARSNASYLRIKSVLSLPDSKREGELSHKPLGNIILQHVSLKNGQKDILKDITFSVKKGTKNAIIGPTAAGKTQLLYVLTGLISPTSGEILYDKKHINEYHSDSFYNGVGLVFQDSIMFNMTLRENVAFNTQVSESDLEKALKAAELFDFVNTLPLGMNTIVSERGTTLSGGQKQRVMLARALALNPTILYLDDFTARVDTKTEKKILQNISEYYPDLTLISVTQKISSAHAYDQIILLMEGEIIARGKHSELMKKSPEYVQIYQSQKSTNQYEN